MSIASAYKQLEKNIKNRTAPPVSRYDTKKQEVNNEFERGKTLKRWLVEQVNVDDVGS